MHSPSSPVLGPYHCTLNEDRLHTSHSLSNHYSLTIHSLITDYPLTTHSLSAHCSLTVRPLLTQHLHCKPLARVTCGLGVSQSRHLVRQVLLRPSHTEQAHMPLPHRRVRFKGPITRDFGSSNISTAGGGVRR